MKYKMIEKISIMEEDWDYLIVIDACRYDYFSKLYKNYLNGELKKFISLGCGTLEWCKESFKINYDDVIYVSANPYINSKFEIKGFKARNHFHKIIDVWDEGWSDELGTVHPKEVNKAVKNVKNNYPNKRLIIHYLQPHEPYLSYNLKIGYPKPKISLNRLLTGINKGEKKKNLTSRRILFKDKFQYLLLNLASNLLRKYRGYKIYLNIRKFLHLPPVNPMDSIQRVVGDKGLRKLYIENLRIVLKYVSELVNELQGTIIITSDHGELLGEDGYYCHGRAVPRSHPLLMEIPWLIVTNKNHVV